MFIGAGQLWVLRKDTVGAQQLDQIWLSLLQPLLESSDLCYELHRWRMQPCSNTLFVELEVVVFVDLGEVRFWPKTLVKAYVYSFVS